MLAFLSLRLVIFVVGSRGKGSCFCMSSTSECRKQWYLELVFANRQGWRVRSCLLLHHRSVGNGGFLGSMRCFQSFSCPEMFLLCLFSDAALPASFPFKLRHSLELTKCSKHADRSSLSWCVVTSLLAYVLYCCTVYFCSECNTWEKIPCSSSTHCFKKKRRKLLCFEDI